MDRTARTLLAAMLSVALVAVLSWMGRMGYLKTSVTHADLMWTAPAK